MEKKHTARQSYCLRKTPHGPAAVLWSLHQDRPRILRVLISRPGVTARRRLEALFPDFIASSCAEVDLVADGILAFLIGEDITFSLDIARMDLCSPFQERVLRAEHGIPRGRVSTYQRIARHIGSAPAARAVGTALANNPFPIMIPCHRAVRFDGTLGGYQGGLKMKRSLLEMEGMSFTASGRVVTEEFFY
ncbi:MAG: methylated-DNA--[protein]-cysteine S-methyltransferase [Syntrophales bacterium]|nr:methylated-DNA--[protein]-cysteine S-methyltransferase [Syntrophales bacterium]